jgi:hypothetical protein
LRFAAIACSIKLIWILLDGLDLRQHAVRCCSFESSSFVFLLLVGNAGLGGMAHGDPKTKQPP